MKARFLLLPLVGLAFVVGVAAQDAAKEELKRLDGVWRIVSVVSDGKKTPEDAIKGMSVVLSGDTYTVKVDEKQVEKGTQKVDPTKKPKTIDINILEGEDKGKSQLGIYELDGDTLKMCFAAAGQARPTEFSSKEGSKHDLGVFQRLKK
jgi:uncharacterized protein (TIGR03067 family)